MSRLSLPISERNRGAAGVDLSQQQIELFPRIELPRAEDDSRGPHVNGLGEHACSLIGEISEARAGDYHVQPVFRIPSADRDIGHLPLAAHRKRHRWSEADQAARERRIPAHRLRLIASATATHQRSAAGIGRASSYAPMAGSGAAARAIASRSLTGRALRAARTGVGALPALTGRALAPGSPAVVPPACKHDERSGHPQDDRRA